MASTRQKSNSAREPNDVGNTDYRSELWKTANLKASSIAYAPAATGTSSPHTRAITSWIFFSNRRISSRLPSTMACSASNSAAIAFLCIYERKGYFDSTYNSAIEIVDHSTRRSKCKLRSDHL